MRRFRFRVGVLLAVKGSRQSEPAEGAPEARVEDTKDNPFISLLEVIFRNYLCGTGCIKTVSLGTTITGSIGIGPLLYFSYKS